MPTRQHLPKHILHQNHDQTITLLDIPTSIAEAQLPFPNSNSFITSASTHPLNSQNSHIRQLISTPPLTHPYPSTEPKSRKAIEKFPRKEIEELLLEKRVQLALETVREWVASASSGEGVWCLERVVGIADVNDRDSKSKSKVGRRGEVGGKRKRESALERGNEVQGMNGDVEIFQQESHTTAVREKNGDFPSAIAAPMLFSNPSATSPIVLPTILHQNNTSYTIPPNSTILLGPINLTLPLFTQHILSPNPKFQTILLDPPWPNRSALRSSTYSTSSCPSSLYFLLSSLPIHDALESGGYIAVWVTNRSSFREMLLGSPDLHSSSSVSEEADAEQGNKPVGKGNYGYGEGGLFAQWGVELVEEWTWVKLSSAGEPIFDIEGRWRKPWEVLLIARKIPTSSPSTPPIYTSTTNPNAEELQHNSGPAEIKKRIIFSVPDLHSRKPNLRYLVGQLLAREDEKGGEEVGEYRGLEIFARNMSAGWWSWGDEVLKFMGEECWV